MKPQHTRGPWRAVGTRVYIPGGGFDLVNCPDAEANAQLVGAAPDLLAELVAATAWIEGLLSIGSGTYLLNKANAPLKAELLPRLHAAIDRARGDTPGDTPGDTATHAGVVSDDPTTHPPR